MQFPYYLHLFGLTIHPHPLMESLAYATGLATYFILKTRTRTLGPPPLPQFERNLWIIAGAILGALAGAKLLAWAENWRALTTVDPAAPPIPSLERWLGGKTIVGGLIGGWIGVEIAKKFTGITQRTGDTWVYPLCISIAIGRVGCFLTGLADQTHGNPSSLPWAVDFGDGIPRHPTQLYEIAFLLLLTLALALYQRLTHLGWSTGRLFRLFMLTYCLWRFLIEFIKPTDKPFFGLSAIQLVSVVTAAVCAASLWRTRGSLPQPADA